MNCRTDGTVWTIPGSRYKSGKDTLIPLSAPAQAIIAAMPVLAGGDHVFSVDGSRPLGDFDGRKAEFDKVAASRRLRFTRFAEDQPNAAKPRRRQSPT